MPAERRTIVASSSLLVVAEPEGHAEAVAKRRREEACPRRRADERERRKVERQRPRARALADDDVEPEVLERRVEDLLDRAVHAMDLVDEEDVLRVEAREDRRHVALPLERGPGDRADADVELLADDRRERRLPEAGWPDEQDVVERLAARLRRLQRDVELLLRALLADEVVESPRPQRLLDLLVALAEHRRQELARHAALLSASRTRSSAGRSGSTAASACSASTSEYPSSTSASRATSSRGAPPAVDGYRLRDRALELEDDALGRLLADSGDRLEARRVVQGDRPLELFRRRARDDGERHLRPDAADAEELHEERALGRVREAVELQRVLADVQVRLDRHLGSAVGAPQDARRRADEIPDAPDVEDEPVDGSAGGYAAKPRDHRAPPERAASRARGRSRRRTRPPRATSAARRRARG